MSGAREVRTLPGGVVLLLLDGAVMATVPPGGDVAAAAQAVFPPDDAPPVPESVPRWAAQAAMQMEPHGAGTLFEAVDAAVKAQANPVLLAWWQGGAELRRDSPALAALSGALGVPAEDVDRLFHAAAAIAESGL